MYEIFELLLGKFGISAYKFCKDTGISQSTISTWKAKKSLIGSELGTKIADYFDVSLEYLMTGKEKENGETYYLNDETRKIAQEVFESKELRMLMDEARDADPEDIRAIHNMLLALKRKERGTID